jgi:hypothetical protein
MNGRPLVVGDTWTWLFYAHDRGYLLKYAIKDLILALGGEKAYFKCQILFPLEGKWS